MGSLCCSGNHPCYCGVREPVGGGAHAGTDVDFLNKFSRQNAALGADVTMKMTKMKALVVGCGGVSCEVVKNLVLQGLGGVTLVDMKPVQLSDLGVNFFLSDADVGKPLAPILVPKFKELNPFCDVRAAPELTQDMLKQHSVLLVLENMKLQDLLKWNDLCRRSLPKPVAFVHAHVGGIFGTVFVDFGPSHLVTDSNGQPPMIRLVESIETGPESLVRMIVPDGQNPGSMADGSYVEFSDVKGCEGLSTHKTAAPNGEMVSAWKVFLKPSDPVNTVRIGDTTGFSPYLGGGLVTEKKVGQPYPFKSFADLLKNPGVPFDSMIGTDMVYFGSELQMHLAFHSVLSLGKELAPGDADVKAVIAKAKSLLSSGESGLEIDVDEELFAKFVRHFNVQLQPYCAFVGGIVAQEVVKIAGKFTPIPGFLHLNAIEALPDAVPTDCLPRRSRYDHLAAVYGHAFVDKLSNLKYFMVGCGALGCEFMKNFALNGVCCGPKGFLTVTDADRIELSNLTRQFLFREHNVGQPKSRAASEMAKTMNPNLKVKALEAFVGAKTEDIFDDSFWMGFDGICNALDNMEARFYVDDQCVKYEKPLFESGTMGPAGNVDPIIPGLTQTYRDGGQADEGGGIPMCTLRNFPHLSDHCIEWARDQFELLFVKSGKQAKKFFDDPDTFISERETSTDDAQAIFEVRGLISLLKAAAKPTVESAGQMAFEYFHFLFRDKIQDLTTAFPENARVVDADTKQDKGPFWSGHKRFPQAALFDPSKETHWKYQVATTALFAAMLKAVPQKKEGDDGYLNSMRSQKWCAEQVRELKVPAYVAGAVNTEGDEAAGGGTKTDSKATLQALLKELGNYKGIPCPVFEEADFEKDDDYNFHVEFITHCANLRADNYHISNSDFQKVKLVAGRIVPAIATTTAAVCGLVMLELFKLVLGKPLESFRSRQIGLAVNTFTSFEAQAPKMYSSGVEKKVPKPEELPSNAFDDQGAIKPEYVLHEAYAAYPEKHSVWNKIKVPTPAMTLSGFRDWLKTEHKIQLKNWGFVLGWKREEDDNGKEMRIPFSTQIYPPPITIDPAHIPSLDDNQAEAMKKIMGNAAVPQPAKMQYLNAWKTAKQMGKPAAAPTDAINLDMTLKDILWLMEKRAATALKDGTVSPKWGQAISGLHGRKVWVIPADQTPSCNTIPIDGTDPVDVRHLARIEIPLA